MHDASLAKLCLALAAALVVAWGAWLGATGRSHAHRRLRDAALALLGLAGLLGWWNFLQFHGPGFVHGHDFFNYYVGSKYFRELGYGRLYECIAVADLEAGLGARVARRSMTDLDSYLPRDTAAIRADPGRCKRHFAAERWSEFAGDVGWFRDRIPPPRWEATQLDHGYNATPNWTLIGGRLAALGPASTGRILVLALLDPLLALAAWSAVAWAFGWRATCLALVYWGTNHPANFSWTGGAFLRDDWLAASLVGLALLRRGLPGAAGVLFGLAASLRVFPAAWLLGPGLAALARVARERRIGRRWPELRLATGALVVASGLGVASALYAGADAWPRFARDLQLHASVPSSNTLSLRTALSWTPEGRLARLLATSPDPGRAWKEHQLAAFDRRRAAWAALVLGYLGLLSWAARRVEIWESAVLGSGAILFLVTPACYYTGFLAAWGLLWLRSPWVGVCLCALAAAGQAIALRVPQPDDVYAASSLAAIGFVVLATALAGARGSSGSGRSP
jgi:hypothetical protein